MEHTESTGMEQIAHRAQEQNMEHRAEIHRQWVKVKSWRFMKAEKKIKRKNEKNTVQYAVYAYT